MIELRVKNKRQNYDDEQRVLHRHLGDHASVRDAGTADSGQKPDDTADEHSRGHQRQCLGLKNPRPNLPEPLQAFGSLAVHLR
jgi:hypothetical protein